MERLCHYIALPAVVSERLSLTRQGDVWVALKTPYRDGTTHVVFQPEYSVLEWDIEPNLLDIAFNNLDGSKNPPLREYLVGTRQVQAMMTTRKGRVVFEI